MEEDPYPCVGICQTDPDSGYCLGCGRPPLPAPVIVAEAAPPPPAARDKEPGDPDAPAAPGTA